MPTESTYLKSLLANFRRLREQAGVTREELEKSLIIGPGWIERFETGETTPSLDMLLAMLHGINKKLDDLLAGLPAYPKTTEIERYIYAEKAARDLRIHFRYANYDAAYLLPDATPKEFMHVIKVLRDGLSNSVIEKSNDKAIKTDAVARAYLKALELWPKANPSDLWWFIILRAYQDPFNHPAQYARLDLSQSWKRTGGWALEEVLVRHYGPHLEKNGLRLVIGDSEEKKRHLQTLKVKDRLEADKMDVLVFGTTKKESILFGVIHVKASFAERRTDDVPMSKALVEAGYFSPLWTMDCKSTPSKKPFNKGELGVPLGEPTSQDKRSAKRKDIEDDGYFSACFSYNTNTKPTPTNQKAKASIYVSDFQNPDDQFSRYVISAWRKFRHA